MEIAKSAGSRTAWVAEEFEKFASTSSPFLAR